MIHAVPNIKAAEKWALQSEKRSARNKSVKSQLKTLFKRAVDSADAASSSGGERLRQGRGKGHHSSEQSGTQEGAARQSAPRTATTRKTR